MLLMEKYDTSQLRATREGHVGIFDSMLSQLGTNIDAQEISERLGLPPDRIERAIAALAAAQSKPGDTVQAAASSSGIAAVQLHQIVEQLGGEDGLLKFASLLGYGRRSNPLVDKLTDLYGD